MHLEEIIGTCENDAKAFVRRKYAASDVFSLGATEIDPRHLAIWITTDTDSQRNALNLDEAFKPAIRDILKKNGYPAEAIPHVAIVVESQETVSRDFLGNWWHAVK